MTHTIIKLLLIITIVIQQCYAFCSGTSNNLGVYTQDPTFVSSVTSGKLYITGEEGNQIPVVHLYGTPYEMGYAHGQLLSDKIKFVYGNYFSYFAAGAEGLRIPKWQIDLIKLGQLDLVLDMIYDQVKDYTPDHFWQEIQGLADGSGVDYKTLVRLHMIPELVRASCSMMGAWNEATMAGGLLQLRALDWDITSPLTLAPVVFVYHPTQGGHAFTTLSWAGFIGSLSGYSGHMGVCEKVWSNYNGTFNQRGMPFTFVMRDILQFDLSVDMAVNRIISTPRTCAIYMGLGSNASNTFSAVEYSYDYIREFDDVTPFPIYSPQPSPHQLFPSVVYIDPDYQSSFTGCMSRMIDKFYGIFTTEMIQQMISFLQTGNLHAAIYDYQQNLITVSVANPNVPWPMNGNPTPAYARGMIQLNVTTLFNTLNN